VELGKLLFDRPHEDMEDHIDLFHFKGVELKKHIPVHQVTKASEGFKLTRGVEEDAPGNIRHSLDIPKIWPHD